MDEFLDFLGLGEMRVFGHDFILDAGQHPQLALHRDIEVMGEIDHLAGEGHVLLERQVGAVDHHR